MSLTFDTTVFSDPQGEALARVYVVASSTVALSDDKLAVLQLNGRIIGPTCRYSSTLQATIPLKHRGLTRWGDRTALVAEAVVPDPCYWSTELPFLYRTIGEVIGATASEPIAFEQHFGIRSVGTYGKRLTFNGRPWVPRIVARDEVSESCSLAVWRECNAIMAVPNPSDELLNEADEAGVLLSVYVGDGKLLALESLRRFSRHPAVAIALVEQSEPLDEEWRSVARGMLLARWYDRNCEGVREDVTDMFVMPVYVDGRPWEGRADKWPETARRPLLPFLPLPDKMPLVEARRACDALQRKLAGKYDVAGYIV